MIIEIPDARELRIRKRFVLFPRLFGRKIVYCQSVWVFESFTSSDYFLSLITVSSWIMRGMLTDEEASVCSAVLNGVALYGNVTLERIYDNGNIELEHMGVRGVADSLVGALRNLLFNVVNENEKK